MTDLLSFWTVFRPEQSTEPSGQSIRRRVRLYVAAVGSLGDAFDCGVECALQFRFLVEIFEG